MINNNTLIYDIETKTFEKPDPSKDELVVFGAYSYNTQKFYYLTDPYDIIKIIRNHKYFVGFNNLQYDNAVLSRISELAHLFTSNKYGDYRIKNKINIDMMQIFKQRAGAMKIKKGMLGDLLMSYSLDYISKTIGIVDDKTGKWQNFDYSILNKKKFTKEDVMYIKAYLKRDLEVTKKMYEWLEKYFEGFKYFLLKKDVDNKSYLTSSISVFTYKAICKELGVEEEYNSNKEHIDYGGGYVSYPAGEHFEGNIYCKDYNSLYPHVFAQCNLFSPAKQGWNGNGVFKVKGIYNDKQMGKIEKLLMKFYAMRKKFKKNKDPREYSVKIIINTSYGLTGNPSFKHLFNPIGAADCTRLGRQWVLLARKKFREAGFEIIYTDTDSVYFKDNENNPKKVEEVNQDIINTIKSNVPFPQPTFDMGTDDYITHMWFFKGRGNKDDLSEHADDFYMDDDDFINRNLGYMKKNYIYIAKIMDDKGNDTGKRKVVYKNLGVKKKSTSKLTRTIFREYLIPKILKEKKVKWKKSYFENLIKELLKKDLMYIATRYKVNKFSVYKNPSQLQAQIAKKYGPGIHFLIRNKKIGVGIGNKYCSIEEFKKNNLRFEDLDLTGVWSELNYFIEEEKPLTLEQWGL